MTGFGAAGRTHTLPHTPYVRARACAHPLHLLHLHLRVQTACTKCISVALVLLIHQQKQTWAIPVLKFWDIILRCGEDDLGV